MRATAVLLCLLATTAANAQQPEQAPPEEFLTPPPMTSAPEEEEPLPVRVPAEAPHPEDAFLPLPGTSAAPVEPPPPPRAAPAPPSPPPPPRATLPRPTPPPRPTAVGPAEPAMKRAARYSRYSAGAGGAAFALTEGMTGLVTGAMLGSAFNIATDKNSSDGYTGAVIGGLTLGTAATIYQYFVPVGRREGTLIAGAATAGLMASLTIANSRGLSDKDRSLLTFATTQAGIAAVLLFTAGGEDVSAGDAGLVGAASLYSFVVVGLVEYIHAKQTGQRYNYTPLLLAPAAGMALGGLLAIPAELSSTSVLEVTAYPLGAGVLALLAGSQFADNVLIAKTVLGTIAGTFLIVGLANLVTGAPAETPPKSASTLEAMPVPVVMSAGRGNDSLAAGPGLFLRF